MAQRSPAPAQASAGPFQRSAAQAEASASAAPAQAQASAASASASAEFCAGGIPCWAVLRTFLYWCWAVLSHPSSRPGRRLYLVQVQNCLRRASTGRKKHLPYFELIPQLAKSASSRPEAKRSFPTADSFSTGRKEANSCVRRRRHSDLKSLFCPFLKITISKGMPSGNAR